MKKSGYNNQFPAQKIINNHPQILIRLVKKNQKLLFADVKKWGVKFDLWSK